MSCDIVFFFYVLSICFDLWLFLPHHIQFGPRKLYNVKCNLLKHRTERRMRILVNSVFIRVAGFPQNL